LQGDKVIVDILRNMGALIESDHDNLIVRLNQLKGINVNLNDCIDLLPTVAVMASMAEGKSQLTGINRARIKESDRIAAVREGLERAGIDVEEEPDRLTITGGHPQNTIIDSKDDHRIAMAFSLLGVAAGGITIDRAECVSKTYPEYWRTLKGLGVNLSEQ
jgi:3-phosphoshikimate 1-carboxyvinyltransferase